MAFIFENFGISLYTFSVFIIYISYFLIFFNVIKIDVIYIHYLTILVHLFVCAFLIIRFNPIVKHELHKNDSNIIFGSAVILFFNVIFSELGLKNVLNTYFVKSGFLN
jgi:hypothetical protein